MHAPHDISWLFLDLNSYFASVEQQDRPALRGRPVAVVPVDSDYTCAIAASYEAKAYGIKTGTLISDAKRMCPKLVCVMARHDIYVDYHHRILDEVIRHVPINKVWSIDELSSRLPPRQRTPEAAQAVARQLKDGLRRNVGEYIRCSIGLAPNGFLAKVATDMQKPDGLVTLQAHELPGRLLSLKLTDLPGINVRMEKRLRDAGICTMADFWNLSPRHARAIWGGVGGERFWYNVHGYDVPDIETNTSMVGHSRVLDPHLRRPEGARLVARRLTLKAAARLRRKDFFATRFFLSAREPEGRRWGMETELPPSQDNFTFLRALDAAWAQMMREMKPHTLKKVSVTMYGLRKNDQIMNDLFAPLQSPQVKKQIVRDEKLSGAMDALNRKFGGEAVRVGMIPQTKAGYVGTKIAFSRIPDKEEFWE
jgi:DNA polymerase-4